MRLNRPFFPQAGTPHETRLEHVEHYLVGIHSTLAALSSALGVSEASINDLATLADLLGGGGTGALSLEDFRVNSTPGYILVVTGRTSYALEAPGTRVLMQGAISARPSAGILGRVYVATDEDGGTPYIDTGSAWQQAAQGVRPLEFDPDNTRRLLRRLTAWLDGEGFDGLPDVLTEDAEDGADGGEPGV